MDMPNLPVARVMWKIKPNLREGIRQWITAGGAHHTVLTYDATPEMLEDLGRDDGYRIRPPHRKHHYRGIEKGASGQRSTLEVEMICWNY